MRERAGLTGIGILVLIAWIGLSSSKYYDWKRRYGQENRHNGHVPRDFWLTESERSSIIAFYGEHADVGYRSLTYMMMDANMVAVSPSTVYRVLRQEGLLSRGNTASSRKGKGFEQPLKPHEHWHVDVSYLNISGTFYYMCTVLDGYSRSIVSWDIRESMTEADIQIILQQAVEENLAEEMDISTRIISDNGPQFLAKDFKAFIRLKGMKHVRTSPYYPQSNGKIERYHKAIKTECIRPQCPTSLEEAKRVVTRYVQHYNTERLHAGIGYITPNDKLNGKADAIHQERDRKLAEARQRRSEASAQRRAA